MGLSITSINNLSTKDFSGGTYTTGGAEPRCTLGNFEMGFTMGMGFTLLKIPTMRVSS
jgi:hypothetical protein